MLPGIKTLKLKRVEDQRGFFCEVFRENSDEFKDFRFVQDNLVLSRQRYTFRGFHGQLAPAAQSKLISVFQGSIIDFALDPNPESKTYGRIFSQKLSGDQPEQLLIPANYLHGYLTLEEDTLVSYKVDNYWSQANEYGVNCRDDTLGINWPCDIEEVSLSSKDQQLPFLSDLTDFLDN